MKNLQVAHKAQEVYKCCKFQLLSLAQLIEALRYKSKIRGSNPGNIIGTFHEHNLSGCTMALQSTHPLTEMNTRNIHWGAKVAGPQGLPPSCTDYHEIFEHQSPGTLRVSTGITLYSPLHLSPPPPQQPPPSPLLLLLPVIILRHTLTGRNKVHMNQSPSELICQS